MSQYDFLVRGNEREGSVGYEMIGEDDDDDSLLDLVSGDDDDDDLLEALSVSGLGDTEIVGALKRAKSAKNSGLKRKLTNALVARNAGAVVNRGLHRRRRYPSGFTVTDIPAGTTLLIPSAPQNLYRVERLVIPSDIAFDIGVVDIKVGNMPQLVQSLEVPGAMFSEVAIDTNVTFDTAEVGNQISIQARNKSGVELEFTAGMLGTVAK